MNIYTSFQNISESAFSIYADTLIEGYPTSSQRKSAVAYLQQINSTDKSLLDTERAAITLSRIEHQKKQTIIDNLLELHSFDFSRQTELFTAQSTSDSDIVVLLTQDNQEVFIKGRSITGDLLISGDNLLLDGSGNRGSARNGSLENTASVLGDLIISGNNVTIRSIDFTSVTDKAIRFSGDVENITVENCKFAAGSGISDSKFWYGEGLEGNLTLKNCYITGFTSWLLMDAHTTSSTPTKALKRVRIKNNYWKDNYGSIAVRGLQSQPTKLVQYIGNKFESAVQHASFWDQIEANNFIKLEVTGNIAVGEVGNDTAVGKRGFLQAWSRSSVPYYIVYKDNTLTNFKVGGKIAHNTTFYAPDIFNENFVIDLSSTHTNVAHAFSFLYKKNDGTTISSEKWIRTDADYTPENIVTYPTVPPVINPNGYSIVS